MYRWMPSESSYQFVHLEIVSDYTLCEIVDELLLSLEQIYNCDETELHYRMLPEKTLAMRSEKEAPGMKNLKERITLMACPNAPGTTSFP